MLPVLLLEQVIKGLVNNGFYFIKQRGSWRPMCLSMRQGE
jgi:predicted RNA binding protein YcfA (HicA-like mRNA interferase family)